ncbi:Hypothetical predicted protein [Paramuricea clavata]|uniref:Uncharacterized protein n=1 Tax=Paramuricea clavata TaxID=317549 RepID=A0A6S7GEL0_PARCT|nr:Hypothetical predicted protein [Paramuricea clavata]
MASAPSESQERQNPSKIPRYCRTQIPVCSLYNTRKHCEILIRNVRKLKKHMKKDVLEKQRSTLGISTCMINTAHQNIGNEEECSKSQREQGTRKVIFTPGGTKRKGIDYECFENVRTDGEVAAQLVSTSSDDFMCMHELVVQTANLEDVMESPGKTSDEKSKSCDADSAKKSLNEYDANVQDIIKLQEHVIATQHEIISSGSFLVNQAKQIFNLKIRENKRKDISEVFNPLLFQQLLVDIKNACPTITAVLELLVLTKNTSRNVLKTENVKMKAAVHLLASMMDIHDQHGNNDIPLLFGLLCLCYGAGPSLIRMLQCLGLSESFPTLISILKTQLASYKEVIGQRLSNQLPVITYQDNMQISRTSLRHLRLSKLQKEKIKQGKMWDFTVRGWREADITGIEHHFNEKEAVEAQKPECKKNFYSRIPRLASVFVS